MSKFRLPVKLQHCPWCVQDLQYSIWLLSTHLCTRSHVKTNTAETLTTAQGPRNNLGATSTLGGSPAPVERLVPSMIFLCSQFLTWISCSGFVFPWGLLYRPNAGRLPQGQKREVLLMQRSCALLKFTSLFQYNRTLKHTKENNPRFSLNVKKPNLFLCLPCSQSYWITFAKIFQKYSGWGKQLARKISVQTLKVLQILWKTIRYCNGNCSATFLIGQPTTVVLPIYYTVRNLHILFIMDYTINYPPLNWKQAVKQNQEGSREQAELPAEPGQAQ